MICPNCGTTDCISLGESNKHITITGAGIYGKSSEIYLKTCKVRQQLNQVKELVDEIKVL